MTTPQHPRREVSGESPETQRGWPGVSTGRWRHTILRNAVAGLCLAVASSAMAAPSESEHLAEQLFEQARVLMDQARYEEACPKLAESHRLDPGGGTILNLALCHEAQGRYASAWRELQEAMELARRDGRNDRLEVATELSAVVEPKVSYLRVQMDEASEHPDVSVRLDDQALDRTDWGELVPVDPGAHTVAVRAPGMQPYSTSVTIGEVADKQVIIVPALRAVPKPHPKPDGAAAAHRGSAVGKPRAARAEGARAAGTRRRDTGLMVLGAGVVGLGAGGILGLWAISKRQDSDQYCSGHLCTDQRGVDLNDQAKQLANFANLTLGFGLGAVLVGTYLSLTDGETEPHSPGSAFAPRVPPPRAQVAGSVGAGHALVHVRGSW